MKKKFLFSFSFFISLLPLSFFRSLLPLLLLKRVRSSKDYFHLKENIKKVLGFEEGSSEFFSFILKNIRHFCLVLGESLKVAFLGKKILVQGEKEASELLEKVRLEGEGSFILVTAHLGAWDLLGNFYQRKTNHSCYALAKPSRSSWVQGFLEIFRTKLHIKLLHTGRRNFQRKLIQILAGGEPVIFLVDQKPHGGRGVSVDFLGYPTEFVKGPAYLAKKFKKPILISFLLRRGDFFYEMVSESLDKKTVEASSVEELTERISKSVDCAIQKNPEQWAWSYKRWD